MKRNHSPLALIVLFLVATLVACNNANTQEEPVQQVVSSGSLDIYPHFPSQHITPRYVTVWLPDGYTIGDSCTVLYMHDGQMLFDAATTWNKQEWCVDEVMGELISANKIRPCIVVAIDNTDDRLNEYFPSETLRYTTADVDDYGDMTPQGDAYLSFLVDELKPFIDEHYRPLTDRDNTFVMGSSMGGLISLYALCQYPHIYGGAACLSTHLSFGHLPLDSDNSMWATAFEQYLAAKLPATNERIIYMDRGTVGIDEPYAPYQAQVDTLFASRGWDESHFTTRVFEGDEHNETCWANRLAEPLTFLLGE